MKKIFTLLLFGVFAWSSVQAQYCTPAYSSGCTFQDDLNSFSISNLSHLNTGCGPNNGFENYTATVGVDTIDLEQGVPYVFTATTNYFSNEYLGIWIDFNNDQDFADAGELLYYSTTSFGSATPLTASFAMPTGQTTGIRRMRVRVIYATGGSAPDPCNSYSFGEAHDYSVNVLPQPACLPVLGVSVPNGGIGSTSANVTWTSTGNDFDVQYGIAGFTLGTGTTVTNVATTNYSIPGLTANTTYDVYVRQDCGMSGFSSWSKATFKTLCAATAIPSTENFDTWPLACFDPLGGGQPFINYFLASGSAAQANMGNWFGQNSAIMTTQPFIIAGPARVKFKWSHAYNQFAPNESILIEAKLETSPNFTDTIFYLSGTNFESNDGAFSWSPGSFKLDLANIPASLIGNVVIRITASSQGFGSSLWLDDFIVEPQPACAEPTNFQFTTVGYNQFSFSFNQATTNNYQIDWGPCGFTQGTASTLVNFSGSSYTLTGLTQNTCYDVYIRTDCNPANGFSAWMGPFSVTTNCAQTLGWTENFDLLPQYSPAPCWSIISAPATFSSQSVVPPWNFTPTSAPNVLDYYVGSDPTNLLISPALIGLDADTTQIRFRMRSQNAGAGQTVIIGTVTSNTAGASFVPADTITINNSMVSYTVMFDNVPAGHQFAAFRSVLPSFSSLYLDDVVFEQIPACIPPNNPVLAGLGATTATVTFGAGGANLYNYTWGPCGFTPGTGTFVSGQTGTSYTATGLTPGTCYDLYMQTDCGVAGVSPWVGPLSFTTLCLPAAMPYTEDFTLWPPNCVQLVNGGLDWQHDATGYATVPFWNGNGQAKMITKSVVISQKAQVKFLWAKQYSQFSPNEALTLRAQIVGNTAWDTLVYLSGPSFSSPNAGYFTPPTSKTDFVSALSYLDSATYVGQTVVFELIGQADFGPWPFVDDFTVEAQPACVPATNLGISTNTATSTTLVWTTPGNGLSNVEWGPQGFVQGTGTGTVITGVAGATTTLTGLTSNTCYDYYVQYNCGVAGLSTWAGPFSWCTPCVASPMPYTQNFNSSVTPSCFTLNPISGNAWTFDGQFAVAPFWFFSLGSIEMNTQQVVISADAQVSFAWAHQFQTFYPNDQLILLARPLGAPTWDTLVNLVGPTFNSPNSGTTTPPNANDFITETVLLNPVKYTGQTAEFRFVGVTGFGPHAFVDDFVVEAIPSCPKPTLLTSSNITQTTADLAWTSNAPGSSWQISYGPPSGTAASGTKVLAPTNPFTLTGLSASANYCFYVREICGPGDTSTWSNSGCFTTACGAVTLPFTEDFTANTLSSCWGNFNLPGNTQTNAFWRNTSLGWPNYAAQGVVDHTGNGGYAMGVDGSSPYPLNDIIMETPELVFTSVPSPELSFWMFSSVAGFGTAADLNELYIDFYNGTTWNNGIYYFKGDSASWFKITVPLSAYPVSGGNAKIRFRVNKIGATAFYNDIIVDDISVASGGACPPPTGVAPSNVVCTGLDVAFVSGSGTSQLEYGPAGFTPGTGTIVNPATSPYNITGLTPGTAYDVYVSDICGGIPGPAATVLNVTTATGPLPSAAFTYTVTSTGATFDGSASTGGSTYTWDFGNSTTGTGVNPSAAFAANGNYTVTLIVGNACGNDTLTQSVFINIGLDDLQLSNSFKAWPNPTQGLLNVEFALGTGNATLEVMDLTGRVLMTEQFTAQGLTKKELNLANYAKGVYLVRVSSGAASATRKITLQ
jgi:PKD repeat protein